MISMSSAPGCLAPGLSLSGGVATGVFAHRDRGGISDGVSNMRCTGSSRRPRCGHQLQRWPALAHPMAMQPQPQPLVAQDHRREPHLCPRSGMRAGRVAGQRDRCRPLPPLPVWVPTAVSASGLAFVAWPARRHPAGEKLQHFGGSGGVGRGTIGRPGWVCRAATVAARASRTALTGTPGHRTQPTPGA